MGDLIRPVSLAVLLRDSPGTPRHPARRGVARHLAEMTAWRLHDTAPHLRAVAELTGRAWVIATRGYTAWPRDDAAAVAGIPDPEGA